MKRLGKCIFCIFASMALAIIPWTAAGQWSEPYLVNQLITQVSHPVFGPGEEAVISFTVTNPFSITISEIEVMAEPYLLAYADGTDQWSGLLDPPSIINATSSSPIAQIASLSPGQNQTVEYSIITTASTTHGGLFSESVFFVKLALSFTASSQHMFYASRGFFTDEQWSKLTETGYQDITGFNTTYLSDLGYSGIIPDISFIVRDAIPIWPAFVIVGIACFTGTVAAYYYLKEDPMAAPRVYSILVKMRRGFRRISPFRRKVSRG